MSEQHDAPRRTGMPVHGATRAWRAAANALLAERERWLLWLPVGLGLGVAVYFSLPVEPPPWLGAALAGAAGIASVALRRRPGLLILGLAGLAIAAGFTAAQARTALVAAPVLEKRLGPRHVTGRVTEVDPRVNGTRIVLEALRIDGVEAAATPARARLRIGSGAEDWLAPGRWVTARAVLMPPPPPVAPGAFDFQRQSYFRSLGAVGFTYGGPEAAAPPDGQAGVGRLGWRLWLETVRQAVFERVRGALEGPTGGVAAALLTGKRGAIPQEVMQAMRDSGLAHLLAISGLHLGLVAGLLFFTARAGLAAIPAVALRYPIKKWAAVAALAGAAAYLVLVGATIPTQRAFLMIGLVLLAVLLDRTAISMRPVAWAASIVLLLAPESLLGPSFQMSFAAVVGLVAGYEAIEGRFPGRARGRSRDAHWAWRLTLYFSGVALTSVIAASATAPFAIYHFNRVAAYGLAANLIAVPVTALWIMPWGLLSLFLMPLGLAAFALVPMGWGIEAVVGIAGLVAGWPGAVRLVPAMPVAALAAVALGGLWLCLWRRRWRLLGLVPIAAGFLAVPLSQPPDILVDGEAKLFAVRAGDGGLMLSSNRAARFSA